MRVPTRSAGTRSGVNWIRLKVPPSTPASVLTVSVLAGPGTPSSRTWPPASRLTSRRSSIASWPTITRLTSWSASWSSVRGSSDSPSSMCMSMVSFLDESAEPEERRRAAHDEQGEARADEVPGDLMLLGAPAEASAELLVHGAELARVGRLEGLAARGLGDRGERDRVGRDGAVDGGAVLALDGDRPLLGAE